MRKLRYFWQKIENEGCFTHIFWTICSLYIISTVWFYWSWKQNTFWNYTTPAVPECDILISWPLSKFHTDDLSFQEFRYRNVKCESEYDCPDALIPPFSDCSWLIPWGKAENPERNQSKILTCWTLHFEFFQQKKIH